MDDKYYKQLVQRYLNGESTDRELEVFLYLVKEGKLDDYLKDAIHVAEASDEEVEEGFRINTEPKRKRLMLFKYAAAIIILLSAAITSYFYVAVSEQRLVKINVVNDALPGSNKAILTLSDGTKVMLDNHTRGKIAQQGQTVIQKVSEGRLVYKPLGNNPTNSDVALNTVSTPRGGQYNIILPDGTKAWLNSVSSITFPTTFSKTERRVNITGEVYFEVIKNKSAPFYVETKEQTIQVLGTHFNVNAYSDEKEIKTTLLEGSINITTQNNSLLLKPGQQSSLANNKISITKVNVDAAVAWKNGYFLFDHTDLPALMRQFSRWYDVKITYTGPVHDYEFIGEIKRDTKLSVVLKILEASGIHFSIENKNLIVQP